VGDEAVSLSIPSAEAELRSIQLDLIPAEMVQVVEGRKALV